jgi:hypothetical protein
MHAAFIVPLGFSLYVGQDVVYCDNVGQYPFTYNSALLPRIH